MLLWVTLLTGLVVLVAGSILMTRVDRRWRPLHQQCGRCGRAWFGRGKFCDGCGARGRVRDRRGDPDRQPAPAPAEPTPRAAPPAPREPLERRTARRPA